MNTRKKKLLVLMMTSAMMTCPVWASDETAAQPAPAAGATGYEPVGKDVVAADVVSAAGMSGTEKMAVNATITARADKATQDTMAAAQSGLTGYETEEELAAIAEGKTPEEIHKAAEASSQESAAPVAVPGTGYASCASAAAEQRLLLKRLRLQHLTLHRSLQQLRLAPASQTAGHAGTVPG